MARRHGDSNCALVITASYQEVGESEIRGISAGTIVDSPQVTKFDCADGSGVQTKNANVFTAPASTQDYGFALLGPAYPNYSASDANGTFNAQITVSDPQYPVLAFGYQLSAAHVGAAQSDVAAAVDWADDRTTPCHYGAVHPAGYSFHWSCLTKSGAQGYLNGPFSYSFGGGTATVTISFRANMQSWPGG